MASSDFMGKRLSNLLEGELADNEEMKATIIRKKPKKPECDTCKY